MTMDFSRTTGPTGLFEDQPAGFITDVNQHITNPLTQLQPFEKIITVFRSQSQIINELTRLQRSCVITLISSEITSREVQNFVDNYLHPNPTVDSYYLLFPDSDSLHTQWTNRYDFRLKWCGPIGENFLRTVLAACSTTCALMISYFERRAQQYESQGDISLAYQCSIEIGKLLKIQRQYIDDYLQYLNSASTT
ncbi:unnamed protein product [Rotaria sp. Silwood1]|nr:unnamed protein product [Rotaria sp. Silwood1]CAF1655996.1 unnamed protein product [Rotaria sp. Silwood1]